MRRAAPLLAGVLALMLAACHSPEARRERGGPSVGADPRNIGAEVKMHEGSRMYYETPCRLPNDECTGPPPASGLPEDFPEPTRSDN